MNGIVLLLNLDMAVMVAMAAVLLLAKSSEGWAEILYPEGAAKILVGATILAVGLISVLKFLRMEG